MTSSKSGLDIMGIPTLIQSISNERKAGTLKIQSGMAEKYIYFRTGAILQVSSPQKPSILAEGLRRHPELDEESYLAVCEEQRKTGQSLASLLLADEEDGLALVTAICQFQILEEICELFTWKDCHSEFTEGDPDPMLFDLEIMDIEPVDAGMVLLEAARRDDEWSQILKVLPSKKDIPAHIGKNIELGEEEAAVFEVVDGFRDVEDILAMVRLSPFGAMSALASLINGKAVVLKNAKELLLIAKLDVFRENSHKRIKLYERALEMGEKSKEINLWLAHSYEAMGMRDKAGLQFREIGFISLQNNLYPVAIRAFEKAVSLIPENLHSHECLLSLLARDGQMEQYAERTTNYARWLSVEGDRDRAIILLHETTEKYPKNLNNLDLLASLYQECGYRVEAVNIYNKLAQLQLRDEDLEGAAKSYSKIIHLDSNNLEVRKNLGELFEKLEKEQEALNHYRAMCKSIYNSKTFNEPKVARYMIDAGMKLTEKKQDDLVVRSWLAEAYLSQDDKDKATKQMKEILERIDEKKDLELLVTTLKNMVTIHKQDLKSRFKLAETYLKMKKEREAVQEYFTAGVTACEMGKVEKALEVFDLLLSFEPSNYATRLKKADILVMEEKNAQAMEELMLTGYLSIGADKLWQAVKVFRQVLSLDRDQVKCYLELGKLYHRLGKHKEAKAAYKKHIQKSVKLSNFGEALHSCENILAIDSDFEWAQTAQEKLLAMMPKIQEVFRG